MTTPNCCTFDSTPAAPAFGAQDSEWATLAKAAAGDVTASFGPVSGEDAADSIILTTPVGGLAASGLRSVHVSHTSGIAKRITSLEEGGGGAASALADYDRNVVCLGRASRLNGRILAAGSVEAAVVPGTPAHLWYSGLWEAVITDLGVGQYQLNQPGGASNSRSGGDILILCTPRVVLAGSDLVCVSASFVGAANIDCQIDILQEGALGVASAFADIAFDWVAIDTRRGFRQPSAWGHDPCYLAAWGSVVGGVAPAFLGEHPGFNAAIVRNGAGDYQFALAADRGEPALGSAIICSPRGVGAASGLVGFGTNHTSAISKQVTMVQEQAAGAASILADQSFDIAIFGFRSY